MLSGKKVLSIFLATGFIAGCATSSDNITAKYVSPTQYNSFNCKQIEAEMIRVRNQVRTVANIQDDQATGDAVAMGVGLVIFWPALFFLIGDDKEEELGQLKGEYQALEQASIQKECGLVSG